jgi:hypothetical protein
MITFKEYKDYENPEERAGRYLDKMIALHSKISPNADIQLLYNHDALEALQGYYLGRKLGHIPQFQHHAQPENIGKYIGKVGEYYPELVPYMERNL